MKVTLDLAISADGFIAKPDGDSGWVAGTTEDLFKHRAQQAGCLVVGYKTYEQFKGSIYPLEDVVNIVLTRSNPNLDSGVMSANSPEEALSFAKERGCTGLVIAGGASTSGAFLKAGLIDEIYFSVHPILLGHGIKPFADAEVGSMLSLLGTRVLEGGIVQLHYSVQVLNSANK